MSEKTKTSGNAELGSAAAPKTAAPAKAVEQTATPAAQAAAVKTDEPKQAPPPTVEQTIAKVETLAEKIRNRGILIEHLRRVDLLKISDFADKDMVTITDSKGNKYEIRSSSLCADIQHLCKRRILAEIVTVEAEINF